jgi:hypothetical protein
MSRKLQSAFENVVVETAWEIDSARSQVPQAVNSVMVQSYCQIGHLIVEYEQQGESRAAYGKQQFQASSQQSTERLGTLIES